MTIRESIVAEYQGRPLIAAQMPRTLGLFPDRGWCRMIKEEVGGDPPLVVRGRPWFPLSDFEDIAAPHHLDFVLEEIRRGTAVVKPTPDPQARGQAIELAGKLVLDSVGDSGEEPEIPVTLDHIYVDKQAFTEMEQDTEEVDLPENEVRVFLTDIRAWWREPGGVLWGDYNVVLPNGKFDPRTVKSDGSPYTLNEILTLCLVSLPGGAFPAADSVTITDAASFGPPTNQRYRYTPTYDVFSNLLQKNGLSIALANDGGIRIVPAFKNHEPFRFRGPGGEALIPPLSSVSTNIQLGFAHFQPTFAVTVVGGPNHEIREDVLRPVYQDEDKRTHDLSDIGTRWGFSVEKAAKQALKSDQLRFRDIPGFDPGQEETRRRIADAWFWRGYQVPGLVGTDLSSQARASSVSVGPFLDPFTREIKDPEIRGVTHRQILFTDFAGLERATNDEIGKIDEEIEAIQNSLESLDFREDQIEEQIQIIFQKLGDPITFSIFNPLEFETQHTSFVERPSDYGELSSIQEELQIISASRSPVEAQIVELQARRLALAERLVALEDQYRKNKGIRAWVSTPFFLVPENEYELIPEYGLVIFRSPFGRLSSDSHGTFNADELEIGFQQFEGPIMRYGSPLATGRPSDWFSMTFVRSGGKAKRVASGEPVNTKPRILNAPDLSFWYDQEGTPINEAEMEEKASKLAEPLLSIPPAVNSVRYRAEGFWPVELDGDVSKIVWHTPDGDQAFTEIAANLDNESLEGFPSADRMRTVSAFEGVIQRERQARPEIDGAFQHVK